jgi:hypothetical protein
MRRKEEDWNSGIVECWVDSNALLWRVSPELNLKVAFGFGVLCTLWFAWRGSSVEQRKVSIH